MVGTCSVCGVAVSGAEVLYTPDGAIVCPRDFANVDVAASGRAPPWRIFAIAGGVVGAIPFAVTVSSSSSVMVNGEVTDFVYRDWIAVACGVVAATLGVVTLWSARGEQLRRAVAIAAGLGVLALGGLQIARGFGVGAQPATSQTSFSFTSPPAMPELPPADPTRPDTCAEQEACFQLGLALDKAKDFDGAATAYQRACELGAAGGCHNAGFLWKTRDNPDLAKAAIWFDRGCELGMIHSCNDLGIAYKFGKGVPEDLSRAVALLEKACAKDDALGCLNLSDSYDRGLGVPADPQRAFELLAKVCDGGDAPETALGCEEAGDRLHRKGDPADAERGASYLARACEREPSRCAGFALATATGYGVPKDPAKARTLYDQACKAGNEGACKTLEAPTKPSAPPKKRPRKRR